jgi:hypothetical protein
MNLLAWNAAFNVVFGDFEDKTKRKRNLLWVTFGSEDFKSLTGEEWEDHAHRVIAQFRAEYAKFADDPWWAEQINALLQSSKEFRALWELHDVLNEPNTRKIFHHPVVGKLAFDYISLLPPNTANFLLSIYVPVNDQKTGIKMQQLLDERQLE